MRKYLIISILMCSVAVSAQQMSVFSFGLRGGGATYHSFSDHAQSGQLGGMGGFDLGYHFYGNVGNDTELGFRTGINAGYTGIGYSREIMESFTNTDYEGSPMDYSITASECTQRIRQVSLEVPAMFALRYDMGFVMDLGMKVQTPIWSQSRQDIEDLMIKAYYPETKVPIVNELITGKAMPEQLHQIGPANLPRLNLLASLEIGYEWMFGYYTTDVFGLKAYVDMSVWNTPIAATPIAPREGRMVDVSPITDAANPVPAVTVGEVFNPVGRHYISFGLKFYYALEVHHRSTYGLHSSYNFRR